MATADLLNVRLESPDFASEAVDVHKLAGRESISKTFELELQVVFKDETPDLDDLVGAELKVVFERDGERERQVYGMISEVDTLYDTEDTRTTYQMKVVPRACRMGLVETLDIFMNMTVPEVIERKLALVDLGVKGVDYELRLMGRYPKREFIVQYKETDLNFVSRLAEHLGISFFFDHSGDCDKIIFTDHAGGFDDISGDPQIGYHRRGEDIGVFRWQTKRTLIPTTYVCRDYNYRTPTIELQAQHQLQTGDAGAIIEYGGHFKNTDEGSNLASIRAEQKHATRTVHNGTSAVIRFGAGHAFKLDGHPVIDGGFLITELSYRHEQAVGTGKATGDEQQYINSFKCIDANLTYRPPRDARIPRIYGVVTGLIENQVQGHVGKYAMIDHEGRYTVKFLFDTAPPGEAKASHAVRRIQPAAGPNYGMHFPLRPGVEVVLVFIDGDPDRPLIVGAVPNPVTPTPVDVNSSTKNRIKTESGVLFEIEDGSGS